MFSEEFTSIQYYICKFEFHENFTKTENRKKKITAKHAVNLNYARLGRLSEHFGEVINA